jgi:hypothetical protein
MLYPKTYVVRRYTFNDRLRARDELFENANSDSFRDVVMCLRGLFQLRLGVRRPHSCDEEHYNCLTIILVSLLQVTRAC